MANPYRRPRSLLIQIVYRRKKLKKEKAMLARLPVCLLCLVVLSITITPVLGAQELVGPTVRHDVHHDVSPPLSEMIKHAPPPSLEMQEAEPARQIPLPPGLSNLAEDPIRQT